MKGWQGCRSFYLLAILKKKRGIALAKRFLVQPEKIVNSEISKPDYIIAQIYKKAVVISHCKDEKNMLESNIESLTSL